MLSVSDISKSDANFTWASAPENDNFTFSIRKKGELTWKDYKLNGLLDPKYSLIGLNQSTAYEIKVTTVCNDGSSAESAIKEFVTSKVTVTPTKEIIVKKINASCGTVPPVKTLKKDLLPKLNLQENIFSGDFTIQVTEASGQNGVFSGKGVIEIWMSKLVKMNVIFDKITINSDHEVLDGKIILEKQ
jgi:hypothetical protein